MSSFFFSADQFILVLLPIWSSSIRCIRCWLSARQADKPCTIAYNLRLLLIFPLLQFLVIPVVFWWKIILNTKGPLFNIIEYNKHSIHQSKTMIFNNTEKSGHYRTPTYYAERSSDDGKGKPLVIHIRLPHALFLFVYDPFIDSFDNGTMPLLLSSIPVFP